MQQWNPGQPQPCTRPGRAPADRPVEQSIGRNGLGAVNKGCGLSGESPCLPGNRSLCSRGIVSGMLGSITWLLDASSFQHPRRRLKSQVKTVIEVSVRFMGAWVSIQIILFHFVTNRLLTFPTLVRFVLPMSLLGASKGFSAFFSELFILPSAFLTGSLTLMYLCGISVFRFRLQPMARHLILCICILPTGSIEDYKGWIFSFAV